MAEQFQFREVFNSERVTKLADNITFDLYDLYAREIKKTLPDDNGWGWFLKLVGLELNYLMKKFWTVSEKGIDNYMSSLMQPFMQSAKAHFDPDKKTWIESRFSSLSKDEYEEL